MGSFLAIGIVSIQRSCFVYKIEGQLVQDEDGVD